MKDVNDKQNRILKATLKLITTYGFHGTPVSMMADEAGVGVGTIYRYFTNKETIINELYCIIREELHQETMKNIPENVSVHDEFYLKWRNILMYFINNPYEASFIEQYSASPYISGESIKENNRRNQHLKDLIARGIAEDQIRNVDYTTITVYMWGTVKQLHHLYTSEGVKITDDLIDDIYSVFWEGIRKR